MRVITRIENGHGEIRIFTSNYSSWEQEVIQETFLECFRVGGCFKRLLNDSDQSDWSVEYNAVKGKLTLRWGFHCDEHNNTTEESSYVKETILPLFAEICKRKIRLSHKLPIREAYVI